MALLTRLDTFWVHAQCPIKWNLIVHDAIIRSKLLHGLESAEIRETQLAKIDTLQLKGIRQILGWKTTYIDRDNTNERLLNTANILAQQEGNKYEIKNFSDAYRGEDETKRKNTI